MSYQLLDKFESTFVDGPYRHRDSTLGDAIAVRLFEDLFELNRSPSYRKRVELGLSVINLQNARRGIRARRGDGTFGEAIPNSASVREAGFHVMRGPVATIEIGIEVKILAKAMIKQIDRVISDLRGQAAHFRSKGGTPTCIGVVGINHAEFAVSYEGERVFETNGRNHKHPIEEAREAEARLRDRAASAFDEFLILRYVATNKPNPAFHFRWLDADATNLDYGAALARISRQYELKRLD